MQPLIPTPPTMNSVDLIHFLPLDEKVRKNLLDIYPDACSYESKLAIEDTLWDYYYALYDMLYQEELMLLMAAGPLPEDYRVTLDHAVSEKMKQGITAATDTQKLDALRKDINSKLAQQS